MSHSAIAGHERFSIPQKKFKDKFSFSFAFVNGFPNKAGGHHFDMPYWLISPNIEVCKLSPMACVTHYIEQWVSAQVRVGYFKVDASSLLFWTFLCVFAPFLGVFESAYRLSVDNKCSMQMVDKCMVGFDQFDQKCHY